MTRKHFTSNREYGKKNIVSTRRNWLSVTWRLFSMLYSYEGWKCMRKRKKCGYAKCAYARISYTTSVEKVHEVKQSQPWQELNIYLAFQLVRVDGWNVDFWTIKISCRQWHLLELHCGRDGLLQLAGGGFTFFVGCVGGHGLSREESEKYIFIGFIHGK